MEKINTKQVLKGILKSKIFWLIILWFFSMGFVYWFRSNYHFMPLIKTFKMEFQPIIQQNVISPIAKPKAQIHIGEVMAMTISPQPTATPTQTPVGIQPVKKFLTSQGAKNREWVLEYIKKYYKGDDIVAFDNVLKNEAGYRTDASNGDSGACGIGQFLPCSKLNCPLDDSGLECQVQAVIGYINRRYGTPTKAWEFWQANNWY